MEIKTLFYFSLLLYSSNPATKSSLKTTTKSSKVTTKAPTAKGDTKTTPKGGEKIQNFMSLDLAPPPSYRDNTNPKFQAECLTASNVYRAKHNVPPLRTMPQVIDFARTRCIQATQNPALQNGENGPEDYGENIYLSSIIDFNNCTKVIEKWYSTMKGYDFQKATYVKGTGQFTQMVWKASTDIGCALCGNLEIKGLVTYVVCNYYPSGNYQGEYPDNVFKA